MADVDQTGGSLSSRTIVGQLASPVRLRIVAAVALGASTPSEVAEATGLDPDELTPALTRLLRSGLLVTEAAALSLRPDVFAAAVRAESAMRPAEDFGATDPSVTRVLRAFLVDGKLTAIPVPGRKRQIVLEYLASSFEPGQRYSEAEVNAILRAFHADVAALRRYLVEGQFLSRESGQYWRSGGWVDVL